MICVTQAAHYHSVSDSVCVDSGHEPSFTSCQVPICVYFCREKDPDPDGKRLAATKDPLAEATKLVQQLKQYAGDRINTHLLAFEVSGPCFAV